MSVLATMAETERFAQRLAGLLRPGDCVLLDGPLGAGKTALARAVLRSLCRDSTLVVPSPSYTLLQTYEAPGLTITHFDLWRLEGPGGLVELGWDEALEGVVLVEWPDRLQSLRPTGALNITLLPLADDPEARSLDVSGWDDRLAALLA